MANKADEFKSKYSGTKQANNYGNSMNAFWAKYGGKPVSSPTTKKVTAKQESKPVSSNMGAFKQIDQKSVEKIKALNKKSSSLLNPENPADYGELVARSMALQGTGGPKFLQGVRRQQAETMGLPLYGPEPTTGSKPLDFLASALGFGLGIINPLGTHGIGSLGAGAMEAGKIVSAIPKVTSKTPVVRGAIEAATAGAVLGGGQAMAQGKSGKEIAKETAAGAAEWGLAVAGLNIAGKAAGKVLTKAGQKILPTIIAKSKKSIELEPWDEMENFVKTKSEPTKSTKPDFVVNQGGVAQKTTPALTGQERLALPAPQQALPEPKFPREGYWFVDQYGNVKATPEPTPALPPASASNKSYLRQWTDEPRGISPTAEYIDGLKAERQKMIDDMANYLIATEANQGVQIIPIAEGGYKRESLNGRWYRDLFRSNGGKRPTKAQILNAAKIEAEERLKRYPEFTAIEAEIEVNRKLPEEWHALNKTLSTLEGHTGEDVANMRYEMKQEMDNIIKAIESGKLKVADSTGKKAVYEVRKAENEKYKYIHFDGEAYKDPKIQAADELARTVSGRSIIPIQYKGPGDAPFDGLHYEGRIFLNTKSTNPVMYVTAHETIHSMQANFPEHYDRLTEVVLKYVADDEGIIKHYRELGYTLEDIPDEFVADATAECMMKKAFWQKVREEAPEILKPILDTIDRIIALVKTRIPKDTTLKPYLRDMEKMRDEVAVVYRDYLKAHAERQAKIEEYRASWNVAKKPMAKRASTGAGPSYNPLEDIADLVLLGTEKLKQIKTYPEWYDAMVSAFGKYEKQMPYIYQQAARLLHNGKVTVKYKDLYEIPLTLENTPKRLAWPEEAPGATEQITTQTTTKTKTPSLRIKKNQPLGDGEKARSFPITAVKSEVTGETTKNLLKEEIKPGKRGAYIPINLKEVDAQAQKMVQEDLEKSYRIATEETEPSALHTALGVRLVEAFQKQGNYERAVDVALQMSERLTKAGQEISAVRIMSSLSPEGILTFAARQVRKANQNMGPLAKKLIGKFELTEEKAKALTELAEKMQNATDPNVKEEAFMEIARILTTLKSASVMRKVSSAQTIAQLFNPKTWGRNVIGNEIFYVVLERPVKLLATFIDWSRVKMTGGERVITFRTGTGNAFENWLKGYEYYAEGLKKGAKAAWKGTNYKNIGSKFDIKHGPAFNPEGNAIERTFSFLERALGAVLQGGDAAAYNRAYNQTLWELAYLRAINTTGKADAATVTKFFKEADENMKNVADAYGQYVTFIDSNFMSTFLGHTKVAMNRLTTGTEEWGLGDLVIKYPKVPGALICRALEYSPAGFLRSAYIISKPYWKGGEVDIREAELALSRAIVGSLGLTGLGYFLASKGVLKGKASDDRDVSALEKQTGQGEYSFNLSAIKRWVKSGFNPDVLDAREGDTIVSYDWAQPVALSIAIGANIQQSLAEKESKSKTALDLATVAAESVAEGANTIAEQPVMTGVRKVFSGETPSESLFYIAKDMLATFTPTLLNQIRQYTDNTARSTYSPNLDEIVRRAQMKVPGLASKLPVAYDTLGQPKEVYPNDSNTLFNVFLNPAFVTKYKVTPEAKMVIEMYKETGEPGIVPRVVQKYIKVGGKRIDLTPEEYSELQRIVGEETVKGLRRIPEDIPPQAKVYYMTKILDNAGRKGKIEILKRRGIEAIPYRRGILTNVRDIEQIP